MELLESIGQKSWSQLTDEEIQEKIDQGIDFVPEPPKPVTQAIVYESDA